DNRDRRRPDDRTGSVEEQERRPRHAAPAGEDGADDAQPGDEAGDEDGLRTMPIEETIELGEARARDTDRGAEAFDETATAVATDIETEIVAEDRRHDRDDDHPGKRQVTGVCQRAAGQNHRFAGDRESGVLEEYAEKH